MSELSRSTDLLRNPDYLLNEQYKNASNLDARIQLHQRFSTNPTPWFRWLFEQFQIAADSRLLELGCGTGELWVTNLDRLPQDWHIMLSDFSAGMLAQAQQSLQGSQHSFTFQSFDAQAIPFADASFDYVIANHMLYHVPDRKRALAEIRRVLKPAGRLYATTVGATNLQEIWLLARRALGENIENMQQEQKEHFTLESGQAELAPWFPYVKLHRREDALVVTEAEPLIAYILSGKAKSRMVGEKLKRLHELVEQELATHGAIHISKDAGLFEAYGS